MMQAIHLSHDRTRYLRVEAPVVHTTQNDTLDALREIGPCSLYKLAKHLKISGPAAYDRLRRLVAEGRVSSTLVGRAGEFSVVENN